MPDSRKQVRWGVALALLAVIWALVLAFVPDPLHRQRVLTVGLDQVEGINRGAPVYFRGAQIGTVRDVALVPERRTFDVTLGVRRDFRPSECSFVTVDAANPLTQPHLELVALETNAAQCPAARLAHACEPIAPAHGGRGAMMGCRRAPDLIALATLAVTQAATVARTAAVMAGSLQHTLAGGGAGGPGNIQASIQNLSGILANLNASLAPGKGDVALTLANVRRASGQASRFDMTNVNETLGSVRGLVAENREALGRIVNNGAAISDQTNQLLQNTSRSLAETSANLSRISGSLDTLTERLSADPTFAVRGQKFRDPPAVHTP